MNPTKWTTSATEEQLLKTKSLKKTTSSKANVKRKIRQYVEQIKFVNGLEFALPVNVVLFLYFQISYSISSILIV